MGVLDERVVDYPDSMAAFQCGPPQIDLWIRPRIGQGSACLPLSQLFDLLVLDAHVLDAALGVRRSTAVTTASVDLAVVWHETLPFDAWRRVRTECGRP